MADHNDQCEVALAELLRHIEASEYSKQNMALLVSKVPVEVLMRVFLMNTEKDEQADALGARYYAADRSRISAAARTSLSASQVCRRWRAIALNHGKLWSYLVDFTAPSNWTAELCRRSGNYPIDVGEEGNPLHLHDAALLDEVMYYSPRFRTFRVQMGEDVASLFAGRFDHPAPFLESFSVIPYSRTLIRVGNEPFPEPAGPLSLSLTPIFGGDAPRLRRFSVSRFVFDFNLPSNHRLTRLSVSCSFPEAELAPSPSKWLHLLAGMPLLEELRIVDSVGTISPGSFPDIRLEHLSKLELFVSLQDCAVLLQHLTFPLRSSLRLSCGQDPTAPISPENVVTILNVINGQVSGWCPDQSARGPLLTVNAKRLGVDTRDGDIGTAIPRDPELSIMLVCHGHDQFSFIPFVEKLISAFQPIFSTLSKCFLNITPDETTPQSDFEQAFRLVLHSLEHVKYISLNQAGLVPFLTLRSSFGTPPLMPHLCGLSLFCTRNDIAYEHLVGYLADRAQYGLSIGTIAMVDTGRMMPASGQIHLRSLGIRLFEKNRVVGGFDLEKYLQENPSPP